MARYEELKGKVAVITGAGRGIGRAIALRLAHEGVNVVVTDIDQAGAEVVAREATGDGGKAMGLKVDVTSQDEINSMMETTIQEFGELNILVSNAGVVAVSPLIETDEQTWDSVMDVNAKGVFLSCKVAARQMIKQGKGGRIIINASSSGKVVPGRRTPLGVYSASKHAALALAKQFGWELSQHQILVNCICPGIIDTSLWDVIDRETATIEGVPQGSVRARAVANVPLQRIGKPEEVANVVAFLTSDDASYLTADTINVDGGQLPY